jgi:nucleoside-diphosphate-sugar epimerase
MRLSTFFITGGSGFIGKHLISQLRDKDAVIYCLSRKKNKKIKNIKWLKGDYKVVKKNILKKVNYFIHLGSSLNDKNNNFEDLIQKDFYESFNLLNKARLCGVKNFLIAGSSFEYGFNNLLNNNTNKKKLFPVNDYAFTKILLSLTLFWWAKKNKINLTYARIFQVYGKGEKKNRLYPYIVRASKNNRKAYILNPGHIRSFVSVEDVAKQLIANCVKNKNVNIVNICSNNNNLSVKRFANLVWRLNSNNKIKIFNKLKRIGANEPKILIGRKSKHNISEKKKLFLKIII